MADRTELLREYRKLAKRADQRIVRLEKYAEEDNFKTATKWAYARAMRDIKQWGGEEATRFNTTPPDSITQLQAKINDIKEFLEKPTSTKMGIIKVYKQKADSINKEYGTNFTWEELGEFFESGTADKIEGVKGSKTMLKAIGVIQKTDKNVIAEIRKGSEAHIKVDDPILDNAITKILHQQDLDLSMFL